MRKLGLALLLLLVPLAASAQDDWRDRPYRGRESSGFELTPMIGYRWGGTIFEADANLFGEDIVAAPSPSAGVIFGIPLGDGGMKLELMASRQSTELEVEGGLFDPDATIADFDVTYYHAGVSFPFHRGRGTTPYIVLSAGVANLDPQIPGATDENRFSASAGLGVKVPMNRNLSLRLEGRGWFTSLNEDDDDRCRRCDDEQGFGQGEVNVGLAIRF